MNSKLSRRIFISQMLLAIAACTTEEKIFNQRLKLVIGVISYGEQKQTIERLNGLRKYLSEELKIIIQLEPAYNEKIALEQIKRRSWSLVFANPGLAAMAIANYQYSTLFPLQINLNSRSIIVVRQNSSFKKLPDLQNKIIALGQKGSATSYYFPLFNLYGLTLSSILFASTPTQSLEWLSQGKVDAAAISLEDFKSYQLQVSDSNFRILFNDSHRVPPGAVLIAPDIDRNRSQIIRDRMNNAGPTIVQDARYIPNASPPDYKYMIGVVKRVTSIAQNLDSKPVRLFN